MTLKEVKKKLLDKLSNELQKDNIPSEDYINFAEAVCLLEDCDMDDCDIDEEEIGTEDCDVSRYLRAIGSKLN